MKPQRKFIDGVHPVGNAQKVRDAVSMVVREANYQEKQISKPPLPEPIDFENFVVRYQTVLESDPCRDLVLFPRDDVTRSVLPRQIRTAVSSVPQSEMAEASFLFSQECMRNYVADWTVVKFNYARKYGESFAALADANNNRNLDTLPELIHECDLEVSDNEADDLAYARAPSGSSVLKQGFLFQGPTTDQEPNLISFKSFKKRYFYLKHDIDGSYRLDFYKDRGKREVKGTINLEFCRNVAKSTKKSANKPILALSTNETSKSTFLAAETEQDCEEWLSSLRGVLERIAHQTKRAKAEETMSVQSTISGGSELSTIKRAISETSFQTNGSASVDECSVELPDVSKLAKETESHLRTERQEARNNIFRLFSEVSGETTRPGNVSAVEVGPYTEHFGTRFMVSCRDLDLKVPYGDTQCQIEPFFVRLAIFDLKDCRKITEDFYCDLNEDYVRSMYQNSRQFSNDESVTTPTLSSGGPKSSICSSPISPLNGSTVVNRRGTPEIRGLPEWELMKSSKKVQFICMVALFSINHAHQDVFVVARIDKILHGNLAAGWEPYVKSDAKVAIRHQKLVRGLGAEFSKYRMPFAWAARPAFMQLGGDKGDRDWNRLYKVDPLRLSDDEFGKMLRDWMKNEKQVKVQPLNGSIHFDIDLTVDCATLTDCVTSSLIPILPAAYNNDECSVSTAPVREVNDFSVNDIKNAHPFCTYQNLLYVNPIQLRFDSQKMFTKARNLSCRVQIRDSDDRNVPPLNCIYANYSFRPDGELFCNQVFTAVLHHETSPQFAEQIKIALPINLTEKHHLLFTFRHISVEGGTSKKEKALDNIVGFAWCSLLKTILKNKKANHTEDDNFITLSVSANLPNGYLSVEQLGMGKGFSGPDIKWVEGGRQLFKISTHLASTVLTKDPHLQNFFLYCDKMRQSGTIADIGSIDKVKENGVTTDDTVPNEWLELIQLVKTLRAVDSTTVINFMPTIINQLLSLLPVTDSDDVLFNIIGMLIHIVHECHTLNKRDACEAYVKFVFVAPPDAKNNFCDMLAMSLTAAIQNSRADVLLQKRILLHFWFCADILVKSMAQKLLASTVWKEPSRTKWASADFQFRFEKLIGAFGKFIAEKCGDDMIDETKVANKAMAKMIKECLNLMNRNFVFQQIVSYLQKLESTQSKNILVLKFDFLKIICNHEHFVPLNIPLLFDKQGPVRKIYVSNARGSLSPTATGVVPYGGFRGSRSNMGLMQRLLSYGASMLSPGGTSSPGASYGIADDSGIDEESEVAQELYLTERYCKNHFLVGLVLTELNWAMNHNQDDLRHKAIYLLRDLLVKHSFDDRYANQLQQSRIAALYFPLLDLAIEHVGLFDRTTEVSITPTVVPDDLTDGFGRRGCSRRTVVSGGIPSLSLEVDRHSRSSPIPEDKRLSTASKLSGQSNVAESNSLGGRTPTAEARSITLSQATGRAIAFDEISVSGSTRGHKRAPSLASTVTATNAPNPLLAMYGTVNSKDTKNLLINVLYVLKNVGDDVINTWFRIKNEDELLDLLTLLEITIEKFKYRGRKRIIRELNAITPRNYSQRVVPASITERLNVIAGRSLEGGALKPIIKAKSLSSGPNVHVNEEEICQALKQESYLSQEVGLIVLDVLALLSNYFKDMFHYGRAESPMLHKIFDIYMSMLDTYTSDSLQKHVYAALRLFVKTYEKKIFGSKENNFCSRLCSELLKCCNTGIEEVQIQACALLYMLMRSNYEFSGKKNFTKVFVQLTIGLSELVGGAVNLNTPIFHRSLSIVNKMSTRDKTMRNTFFQTEVKEVVKRLRTVLNSTAQLAEYADDPEILAELQYSLANSYSAAPVLRKTWLESLVNLHSRRGDWTEAAYCQLHVCALMAEFLKRKGIFTRGCELFRAISDNIEREESLMKDDDGSFDEIEYDRNTYIGCVEKCVILLQKAERYELLGVLYRLICPMYEQMRLFETLSIVYGTLSEANRKIESLNKTSRRMFGSYFRVTFFGQSFFDVDHAKEFIYKEPKVTKLNEIATRLREQHSSRFGKDTIYICTESETDPNTLDSRYGHIQISHVEPYFDELELPNRTNDYERNTGVTCFVYAAPFTKIGGKQQTNDVTLQWVRKTYLHTPSSFPFVVKRIEVDHKSIIELNPLERAIAELTSKTDDIERVIKSDPIDLKRLHLVLQGAVQPQVNQGALVYAESFVTEQQQAIYQAENIHQLRNTYRRFLFICNEALRKNDECSPPDSMALARSLWLNYGRIVTKLTNIFGEQLMPDTMGDDARSSASFYLNSISSTTTTGTN